MDEPTKPMPENQPEPAVPPPHLLNYIAACTKYHEQRLKQLKLAGGAINGAELQIEHDVLMHMIDTLIEILCRFHNVDHAGLYNAFAFRIGKEADNLRNTPSFILPGRERH